MVWGKALTRKREEKNTQTQIGIVLSKYEKTGALVPDSIMKELFGQILDENSKNTGIILDGYPRTIPQVDSLLELVKERNLNIKQVINIEVPKEELLKRAKIRAETSDREDDKKVETHIKRINIFEESTKPAIELKSKLPVDSFDGLGTIEDITKRIIGSIKH